MSDFVQAKPFSYAYAGSQSASAAQQTTAAAPAFKLVSYSPAPAAQQAQQQDSGGARVVVQSQNTAPLSDDKPHGIPLLGVGIAAGGAAVAGILLEVIRIAVERRKGRRS